MADNQGSVIIDIVLDDGSVKQVMGRITKQAKETSKETTSAFSGVFSKIGPAAAAAGAAIVAAFGAREILAAGMTQEAAVTRMNQALASAGRFSREASQDFQNFASEMQKNTVIGDEMTLELLALASNFARTNEQAKALTAAAVDLSAATGKDLKSSLETLGKTLSGEMGRLGQEVPAIKNLSKEALRAGDAIAVVAARFSGSAAAQVNTFGGALTQAKNAFGDLLEEIGLAITGNKYVVAFIKGIGDGFVQLGASIKNLREGGKAIENTLGNVILISIEFARVVNRFLIAPAEAFFNMFKAGLYAIQLAITAVSSAIVNQLNFLAKFLPNIEIFKGLKETLSNEALNVNKRLSENWDALAKTTDEAFNLNMAGSVQTFLDGLKNKVENAKEITQDFKNNVQASTAGVVAFPGFSETVDLVLKGFDTLGDKSEAVAKQIRDSASQAGAAMFKGFGTAAGQAFASFGKAIVTGENAMQAFLNSLLATIGQASIQLGTNFILQGAAYSLAGLPNGPALIGAGAALAAFGGILSGLGGGAASAPEPATPGGVIGPGGNVLPGDSGPISDQLEPEKPKTDVVVNINGSVYDSDETGMRIVDLINSAFDKQGVVIRRGVVA